VKSLNPRGTRILRDLRFNIEQLFFLQSSEILYCGLFQSVSAEIQAGQAFCGDKKIFPELQVK